MGELSVAHARKLVSLDPQQSVERATQLLATYMYDPLLERDAQGNLIPRLALSWENTDEKTWVFQLREGVTFHNGEPFNSQAVKYTLDRFKTEALKGSPLTPLFSAIDSIETPNDYTVTIKTAEPFGPLLQNLTQAFIVPPKATEAGETVETPIGTGAFKFVEWVKGDRVVLEANPEYFDETQPKVARLVWKDIAEMSTRMTAFETGEVDVVAGIPAEDMLRFEGIDTIKVASRSSTQFRYFWMNGSVEPFDNPLVRKAVKHAVDYDSIINDIMGGYAQRADSYIEPPIFGYVPQEPYKYDPELAKQLLEEAGYPNGIDVTMKWADTDQKQKEVVETLIAQMAESGIRVKSELQERSVWLDDLLKLNWELNLNSTGSRTGDGDYTLRRLYHSRAKRTGYVNSELDTMLDQAAASVDPEVRLDLYAKIQKLLWDDGPTVMLFYHVENYGWNDRVQGFEPPSDEMLRLRDVSVQP